MDVNNQIKTLPTLDSIPNRPTTIIDNKKTVQSQLDEVGPVKEVNVEQQEQTKEIIEAAVNEINEFVQSVQQRSLQFTVDEESGKDIVTVLDKETEEVIRQLPSDEVLAIARRLAEQKVDGFIQLFSSTA